MRPLILLSILTLFVGCGKVAQDISSQSNKSIFKEAKILFNFSTKPTNDWTPLVSSKNVSSLYSYYSGIQLDRGAEKIGWVQADVTSEYVATHNKLTVSNFDLKKNTVTTSRYLQGYISIRKVATNNYQTMSQFRKVRPKFDYYSFSHYLSKDVYAFLVTEKIATQSMEITPYKHLVSAVYLKHLNQESYNRETTIPLSLFYKIIPKSIVSPTLNVMPQNFVKKFRPKQPLFILKDPFMDALLASVTLVHHSDEYDVLDYIKSKKDVFSKKMVTDLTMSVKSYYKNKKTVTPTSNVKTNNL